MGGTLRGLVLTVVALLTGALVAAASGAVVLLGLRSSGPAGDAVSAVAVVDQPVQRRSPSVVGSWSLDRPGAYGPQARQYGVFVSLSRGGRLRAVDGCLEYRARYSLRGTRLRTRAWSVVRRDCLGMGAQKDQPLVKVWRGTSRLKVRTVEGRRHLVVRRAGKKIASATRIGRPGAMILLPGLYWTIKPHLGSPLVKIDENGTLLAESGCGWLFEGTWTGQGPTVDVHVDSTVSRCPADEMKALARTLPYPLAELAGKDMQMSFSPRNFRVTFSRPTP